MSLKAISIGTGVLLLLAVAGVVVDRQRSFNEPQGRSGQALLETIDMADAAAIEIASEKGTVTITRKEQGWVVEEQFGFPASPERIRRFLLKLSAARIERLVTKNTERLRELGLLKKEETGDAFEEGKTATSFVIKDKAGEPLFSLLIGKDRRSKAKGLQAAVAGQFVRFPDSNAAYLIPEPLFVNKASEDWVEGKIFPFDHKNLMKAFRVWLPGEKPLSFTRKDADSEWRLVGGGRANLDANEVKDVARRIGDIEVALVGDPKKGAKGLGRDKLGIVEFDTFDMRTYRMKLGMKTVGKEFRYMTLEAKMAESAKDAVPREKVAAFNRKFAGHVVAIYEWEAEQFLKKKKELLAKDKK